MSSKEVVMRSLVAVGFLSLFTAAALACGTEEKAAVAGDVVQKSAKPVTASFAGDVLPILKASCARCHGNAGDLSLESYGAVMAGAKGEKIVVPGNPDGSALLKYVDGRGAPRMPLGADPLSAAQINTIRAWIAAGAKND
jgi:mono/diheme cytochrome c family protein